MLTCQLVKQLAVKKTKNKKQKQTKVNKFSGFASKHQQRVNAESWLPACCNQQKKKKKVNKFSREGGHAQFSGSWGLGIDVK